MRPQDIGEIGRVFEAIKQGRLPDVGKRHPRSGYRIMLGWERTKEGRLKRARYALGKDRLFAQVQAEELWTIYGQAVIEALDAAKMTSYDAKRLRAIKPVMPPNARERAYRWARRYARRIKALSDVVRDFVAKHVPGHKLVHD